MKLLFEILPIIIFFVVFKLKNIIYATAGAMVASCLLILWQFLKKHKIDPMQWVGLLLILFFGGLTIILNDKDFIKIKPTILYWGFSIALICSSLFFKKNLIHKALNGKVKIIHTSESIVWNSLNISWILFLGTMGALNLFIAKSYDDNTWAYFKLGSIGLFLIFTILQGIYLNKYIEISEGEK